MNITRQPVRQKAPRAKKDPKRLARVKGMPCVICNAPPPSDAHHCCHDRFGQRKSSDAETIPLCKIHHQDGPEAIHTNKRAWREKHGPDHGFLQMVDDILGEWF